MKKFKYFALAAAVLLCGTGLTTSCSGEDSPEKPPTEEQEAKKNRDELISHIENDAKTMADVFSTASLNIASQAYDQLLALMESDKTFLSNMRLLLSALSENQALLTISPAAPGSELAKMGYPFYITADNSGFGVRVVFDGKGNSRLQSADNMEFIFPATVKGIGTTLFKLIIKGSNDYYQTVTEAQIQNVKRLACVNRFPKSLTMTLTGFIDNKELKLSEGVISLELPQNENSSFVSLDVQSFSLTGKQSNYNHRTATIENVLDFSLSNEADDMTLAYGYTSGGVGVANCEAKMNVTQPNGFIGQMFGNAFDIVDIKEVSIRILDDLTLAGIITDGAEFAQCFTAAIKNRQLNNTPDVLAGMVESLNRSCHAQLSCEQMTKPEPVKFCVAQEDGDYVIEPALKDLTSNDYLPISQLVDAQTMEYFNQSFNQSFTPGGNTTGSALKIYSAFIQMMPMTNTFF